MAIGSNHRKLSRRLVQLVIVDRLSDYYYGFSAEEAGFYRSQEFICESNNQPRRVMQTISSPKPHFRTAHRKHGAARLCAIAILVLAYGTLLYYVSLGTGGL
jgi:hypothetical protein